VNAFTSLKLFTVLLALASFCSVIAQQPTPPGVIPNSGIPAAIGALARSSAPPAKKGFSAGGGFGGASQIEAGVSIRADLTSRSQDEIMSIVRDQVKGIIGERGAAEAGHGESRSSRGMSGFSFKYTWSGNRGIIHAFARREGDELEIVIICYEHKAA
jgi:hypothetical protein